MGVRAEGFKGYCFEKDGSYYPAVNLNSAEEVVQYIKIQKQLFYEVRIIVDDDTVAHAVDGKVVFPPELKMLFEEVIEKGCE